MPEQYLNLALLKNQSQTAPAAPNGLVMQSVQAMTLEIHWNDASSNESGFYIERNPGPNFPGFTRIFQTGSNVQTFQDTNLNPATAYRYRVQAFNGQGVSAYTNTVEITTLNAQAVAGLNDFGTLQDEIDTYGIFGWTFTSPQLPSIANGPYTVSGGIDVHGSLEADDLWQNIKMAARTGIQGYADLASAWATYYKNSYFSDFTGGSDEDFGYDHTFGWGLVDWAALHSDPAALAAANTIADRVQAFWYDPNNSDGYRDGFYSLRGPGRHLKLACALNRRAWADDIWNKLKNSWRWSERPILNIQVGFWSEDPDTFSIYPGNSGSISSFEFGVLNNGIADYYELTGNVEAGRRLVLMARFAQLFGLEPNVNHTGTWIICDFPGPNQFLHRGLGVGITLQPFYTCALVNTLVRGYLLTGDTALLNRAKLHWDRSSRATAGDDYPYTNRPADVAGEVDHFMNKVMQGSIFYGDDGEITYVGLLFKAIVSLNPNLSTPNPPTALTVSIISSSQLDLHWTDNSLNETGFKIERDSGSGFVQIALVGVDVNSYADKGLTAATSYSYRVRATNNNGDSAFSNTDTKTTSSGGSGSAPTAPSGLTVAAVSYSQINLSWTDNSSDENGFIIKRCSGAACSPTTQVGSVGPNATTFSDFGLAANTLYRYTVEAFNGAGNSSPTSVQQDTTPTTTEQWEVLPNSSWRTFVQSAPQSSYILPRNNSPQPSNNTPDGKSDHIENILNCWSSGLIFQRSNGEQWLVIKNGGHDSWFWNDVWGYRINGGTPGWVRLRQSFLPYITVDDWDNNIAVAMDPNSGQLGTGPGFNIYTDGSPGNAHTYDMCGYIPATDEVWYFQGAHTNGNGKQAPIHFFSMATKTYRYAQNWFSVLPTHFAVTDYVPSGPRAGHILIDGTRLIDYDPSTFIATDLGTSTQPEYVPYSTGRYVGGKMYVFGPKTALDPQFSQGMFCKIHEEGVQGETILNTSGPVIGAYSAPGVVWEPDISKFVVWCGNRDVGFLDPITGIKTLRTVPGADPGEPIHFPGFNHTGTYKRFERLGSGVYILMNSIDEIHKLTLDLTGSAPTGIQFNGAIDLAANDGASLTLSGNFSCSGSNRYGFVAVMGDNNQGGGGVDGIATVRWGTSGGASNDGFCTLLRKKISGFPDTDARMMYLFGIVGPPTGSQPIVITANAPQVIYGLASAYTGVQQSAQPDAVTDHASPLPTSSSLTSQLTTLTDNAWVIMFEQSYDTVDFTPPTQGAGDVRRISSQAYGNMSLFDSNQAVHPAAPYNMTTSRPTSPTVRGITHILVSLKPA